MQPEVTTAVYNRAVFALQALPSLSAQLQQNLVVLYQLDEWQRRIQLDASDSFKPTSEKLDGPPRRSR